MNVTVTYHHHGGCSSGGRRPLACRRASSTSFLGGDLPGPWDHSTGPKGSSGCWNGFFPSQKNQWPPNKKSEFIYITPTNTTQPMATQPMAWNFYCGQVEWYIETIEKQICGQASAWGFSPVLPANAPIPECLGCLKRHRSSDVIHPSSNTTHVEPS